MSQKHKTVYKSWKQTIQIMIAVGIAIAFFLLSKDDLLRVVKLGTFHGVLVVGAFISVIIWFGIYMFVMISELELLNEFLDLNNAPRPNANVFLKVIMIGVSFGVMIAFTHRPLILYPVAIILEFFDILIDCYAMKVFYISSKNRIIENHESKKGLSILYDFYLLKPLILRDILILVSFFISLILTISNMKFDNIWLLNLSYLLFIFTIIISLIVIILWRKQRDLSLEFIDSDK